MIYYVMNTSAETETILEIFPTQEGAYQHTNKMQPWFTQPIQVVRAVDQQYLEGGLT